MKRSKLIKKPFPCSFYDITGIQSWLDEMALQGLFLDRLSYHSDRAFFQRGEPRPVRYRLDPLGEKWNDVERKENYAQMGWEFVDAVPRFFYIFSCADPEAPELHSDPAALSYALKKTTQRQARSELLLNLFLVGMFAALFLLDRNRLLTELILREHPLQILPLLILAGMMVLMVVYEVFQFRRLRQVCRALDLGLSLNAGKRHRRLNVPYIAVYLPVMLLVYGLNGYATHYTTVQTRDLDLSALSRPWPDLVQLEERQPTTAHPENYSYMTLNHSPAAPVQEHFTNRWGISLAQGYPYLKVWHYQTSSPAAARRLYRLERDKLAESLQDNNSYPNSSESITGLVPLAPGERPGLDELETASFHYKGLDGWAFALRRENDVLLVRYSGQATLEEGLELFLAALDQPQKGV